MNANNPPFFRISSELICQHLCGRLIAANCNGRRRRVKRLLKLAMFQHYSLMLLLYMVVKDSWQRQKAELQ